MSDEGGRYRLEGKEVESCDCYTLCPCVLGNDPDHGGCQGILARLIESGEIDGVDVSGLTWLEVFQSPGNMTKGNIRKLVYVDRTASFEQVEALRNAFEGRIGGPLADLAKLTSQIIDFSQTEIEVHVEEGEGRVSVSGKLRAVMAPYRGRDGTPTTLHDATFSSIPHTPAWLSKSSELTVVLPEHGIQFSFEGRSAIESRFQFVG